MIDLKIIVFTGSAACFAGCIGDFLSLFILGPEYPGYSQMHDTMSSLGSSTSPVSDIISAWWVILGILMIIFAFGFRAAYPHDNKYVRIVFWLLILYGLGEGLGSGLFKADRVSGSYITSCFAENKTVLLIQGLYHLFTYYHYPWVIVSDIILLSFYQKWE
jgi:hypothetical membrane protein